MGQGVTYVSGRKITSESMEGIEATYAFRDITRLQLNEEPDPPSVPGVQQTPRVEGGQTTFRFSRLPNGHSLLTAAFAQSKPVGAQRPTIADSPATSAQQPTPEQLEQLKKLFAGLHIGMAIEVHGTVIKTNSAYQEGDKVTLVEMDFSELLSNDAMLAQMAAMKGQSLNDAKELLKGLRGFKVNLEPEVKIEFTAKYPTDLRCCVMSMLLHLSCFRIVAETYSCGRLS
jgi:hypothetical protein